MHIYKSLFIMKKLIASGLYHSTDLYRLPKCSGLISMSSLIDCKVILAGICDQPYHCALFSSFLYHTKLPNQSFCFANYLKLYSLVYILVSYVLGTLLSHIKIHPLIAYGKTSQNIHYFWLSFDFCIM